MVIWQEILFSPTEAWAMTMPSLNSTETSQQGDSDTWKSSRTVKRIWSVPWRLKNIFSLVSEGGRKSLNIFPMVNGFFNVDSVKSHFLISCYGHVSSEGLCYNILAGLSLNGRREHILVKQFLRQLSEEPQIKLHYSVLRVFWIFHRHWYVYMISLCHQMAFQQAAHLCVTYLSSSLIPSSELYPCLFVWLLG